MAGEKEGNDLQSQINHRSKGLGVAGEVIKDSFTILGTLRVQAGYTVYNIAFKVAAENSEGRPVIQELETLKRFTDFQNLSKQLEIIHGHSKSKIQFPSLVKAKYFERFKDTVIEERKKSAQQMLYFVTHYPHLANSAPLRHFIVGAKVKRISFPDTVAPISSSSSNSEKRGDTPTIHPDNSTIPKASISEASVSDAKEEEGLSVGCSASVYSPSKKEPATSKTPDATSEYSEASSNTESQENLLSDCNTSFETLEVYSPPSEKGTGELGSSSPENISLGNAENSEPDAPASNKVTESAGKNEMSWWADAMAETDNITEDLDEVVDKIGEKDMVDCGKSDDGGACGGIKSSQQRRSRTGSNHSNSQSPQLRKPSPSARQESAYIVQAGRLISQALLYEKEGECDEAFDLLKAGVDVLLNGVQTDKDKDRREVVRRKTSEYLLYAENLQKQVMSKLSGAGDAKPRRLKVTPPPATSKRHLLQDFKVKKILGKVILVESRHTGDTYIFKVLHKSLKAMEVLPKLQSRSTKNRSPLQCPHIVRLLQYYETPNHRIFLLLEHIKRGELLEFVNTKREQWRRLREAAANPPPSSSLITRIGQLDKDCAPELSTKSMEEITKEENGCSNDEKGEDDDAEMERMLRELTDIVPPSSSFPPERSLTSENEVEDGKEEDDDDDGSLDALAVMRQRLEESMLDDSTPPLSKGKDLHEAPDGVSDSENDLDGKGECLDTSINVLPPTPTVNKDGMLVVGAVSAKDSSLSMDSLSVTHATTDASLLDVLSPSRQIQSKPSKSDDESSDQEIFFSPASSRNSPDLKKVDDWVQRLEGNVRQWTAQIILALEHLHKQSVICRDLHSGNVLLDEVGNAVLTYFGKWDFVEEKEDMKVIKSLYMAPELQTLNKVTEAADWWSLGAFLFELLTGENLVSCHPGGIQSHLPLQIPVPLSSEAQSLLTQLLQISPTERLGSGSAGVEELKAHPFFAGFDWASL